MKEERKELAPLPLVRLTDYSVKTSTVSQHSTIRVNDCTYSVPSRLIGEKVKVHLYEDHLEVWYARTKVQENPRLRGKGKKEINYRHLIHSLKRKPGAFKDYKHRDCLYPTTNFRIAYDLMKKADPLRGHKAYISLLELAATHGELGVERAIKESLSKRPFTLEMIQERVNQKRAFSLNEPEVTMPSLAEYDSLIIKEARC